MTLYRKGRNLPPLPPHTRLWAVAENLHRSDLTATERAAHIAEWIRLTDERRKVLPAQVAPKLSFAGEIWRGSSGVRHQRCRSRARHRAYGCPWGPIEFPVSRTRARDWFRRTVSRLCQVRRPPHRVERGADGGNRCLLVLRVSWGSAPKPPLPYLTDHPRHRRGAVARARAGYVAGGLELGGYVSQ